MHKNMQCDVGADDSFQLYTWRASQNRRFSPWPMQKEMGISTPPMKSWSPGRTLLSTRCHWAMSSSQSKAHALPTARHHQHVRIILRNFLAVPSPCRGISEDANCDMKTVRRCGSTSVSFCSATPKCTASRTISEQRSRHPEAVRACGLFCCVRSFARVCAYQIGAPRGRAISVSSQREWLQNSSFIKKTI